MAKQYRYNTIVNIEPFIFKKFPYNEDRFSTIIVSSNPDAVTSNLVQYILNSMWDEIIIPATDDIASIEKKLRSKYISPDELRRHVAIIDISKESIFKNMRKDICTLLSDIPDWLRDEHIRNIIMPNMDIQSIDGWQNNFSHTIWLTDSIENLPKVLITNSHYLFLTDNIHISKFMKNKYSNDFKTETDDEILVIGMTIVKDMTINTLNKSQFT